MKIQLKLNPHCYLEYDTCTLSFDLKHSYIKYAINVEPYPFRVNAEKYLNLRTKFRILTQKIQNVTLILPRCSGNCLYCSNKNFLHNHVEPHVITSLQSYLNSLDTEDISFSLTGGEPLENLDLVYELIDTIKSKKITTLQLFTTLWPLINNSISLDEFISFLNSFNAKRLEFYITIGGNNARHFSCDNQNFTTLLKILETLKNLYGDKLVITFKHILSSPTYIEEYFTLIELKISFRYTCLGLSESIENSFSKHLSHTLYHNAKKNFHFIKMHSLPIRHDISYVNANISTNILSLLQGNTVYTNNAHYIFVYKDHIKAYDPVTDYICYNCHDKICGKDNCKKIYKRCLKCPILYTCCFTSALIPYYTTTMCNTTIRAELVNYLLYFKKLSTDDSLFIT